MKNSLIYLQIPQRKIKVLVYNTVMLYAKITEKTAKKLRKCKIAVRFGIGYDQVDYDTLRKHGFEFASNLS
ncbi:hypothetical protein LBE40_01955 [Bartonella taylorii]|nr:hypothetical protein LBE40_01955 [Bartonella taylorii]